MEEQHEKTLIDADIEGQREMYEKWIQWTVFNESKTVERAVRRLIAGQIYR